MLQTVMTQGRNHEKINSFGVIRAEMFILIHLSTNLSEGLVCHPDEGTS
jgi:hypothetical protein